MLGRLLKYEFRATGRVFLPMYAVLLVMSVVARLLYSGQLRRAAGGGFDGAVVVIVTLIMIMLFTAVWVVTLALILRRFWRNLLGREGYLMNVLPVSSWAHVGAKLIVAAVWVILSALVSAAALWIMLERIIFGGVQWLQLLAYWNEMWAETRRLGLSGAAVRMIAEAVLGGLLGVAYFILAVYAAMCVGQLVNKHRTWASIGAYFGISVARSVLTSWLFRERLGRYYERFAGIGYGFDEARIGQKAEAALREAASAVNREMTVYLLFTLACCAVLYFVSAWIMKNRLNLQ